MATSPKDIILFASTFCFLSLICQAQNAPAPAPSSEVFTVVGKVYCDTCRAQFVTRISKYMQGAKVKLECTHREGGQMTHTAEAETDETGTYKISVVGDHEEEVCDISLAKSPDPECSEIDESNFLQKSARISLAVDSGITSTIRLANPLGFMVKKRLPECAEVLKELGITTSDLE